MSTDTLSELEPDAQTVKRAQWEAFAFELEASGIVQVTNNSYADPDEHSYLVNVEDGAPVACDCPAFRHQEGACKHLVAVAIREPVLQAAQAGAQGDQPTAMADGGAIVEGNESDADVCQHGQEGCPGPGGDELPCWDCFQTQ